MESASPPPEPPVESGCAIRATGSESAYWPVVPESACSSTAARTEPAARRATTRVAVRPSGYASSAAPDYLQAVRIYLSDATPSGELPGPQSTPAIPEYRSTPAPHSSIQQTEFPHRARHKARPPE